MYIHFIKSVNKCITVCLCLVCIVPIRYTYVNVHWQLFEDIYILIWKNDKISSECLIKKGAIKKNE